MFTVSAMSCKHKFQITALLISVFDKETLWNILTF